MFDFVDNYRSELGLPPKDIKAALVSLGASRFPKYPILDAQKINEKVEASCETIVKAFVSANIIPASSHLSLFNSQKTAGEQMGILRDWLATHSEMFENVFVVFNGHGQKLDDGRVQLAIAATDGHFLDETTLSPRSISKAIETQISKIARVFMIFDCCYAGSVIGHLVAGTQNYPQSVEGMKPNSGWAVVVSCGRGEDLPLASNFPAGTPLSTLLAQSIEHGIPHRGPGLSVFDLVDFARAQIRSLSWDSESKDDWKIKRYPLLVNTRVVAGDPSREQLFDNVMYDDLAQRLDVWLKELEAGNPKWARVIGDTFDPNVFTAQGGDPDRAMLWYLKGAALGDPFCCYKVGWFYNAEWCPSYKQDPQKSLDFWMRGAALGSQECEESLFLYFNAEFVRLGLSIKPHRQKPVYEERARILARWDDYRSGRKKGVWTVHS